MCLQAAGRGFLVRRWVQKLCMLLRMSLQHIATCPVIHLGSPIHPVAPTQEAIWVCNLPVWTSTTKQSPRHLPQPHQRLPPPPPPAVHSVPSPAWVSLDRTDVRLLLGVGLLSWDPGGRHLLRQLLSTFPARGRAGLQLGRRCHGGHAAGSGLGTRMVSSCMGTCNGQQACRSPRRLVAERANAIKAINSN